MRYILSSLFFILFAQHSTALPSSSNVLLRGCDVISSYGRCYNFIQDSPLKSWIESQSECTTYEQDLASFSSSEEVALVGNLLSSATYFWIGLNDIDVEGSYVWTDGSDNEFTSWGINEPDTGTQYNCVLAKQNIWGTYTCTNLNGQHACSSKVTQIGHRPEGMNYIQLMDNSKVNENTTLICITELYNSSGDQIQWEYTELDGTVIVQTSSTDAMGISELAITLDKLGNYSCLVTQDGGALTVRLTVTLVNTTIATTQPTTIPTNPSTQPTLSTQSVNTTATVNATVSVIESGLSSYSSQTILLSVIMVLQFVIIMSMMVTGLVALYVVRIRVIG